MKYDFDKITDRRGTMCLKYDFAKQRGKKDGLISMWVADMDFPTAPVITERLKAAAEHGIFGYTESDERYYEAVSGWYERHFGWKPAPEYLVKTPGVVFALAAAVRAYTEPGDAVLIQQPVYYPFSEVIIDNGRRLVNSPLKLRGSHYEIDFDDFEAKIRSEQVKLFLLCSPHNPVGRVWTEEELRKIGDICLKYGVIIVSDEIHSDFVWGDRHHTMIAGLDERYAAVTVTCTAPSKTFNIAGLQVSNIFIPDRKLRHAFRKSVAQAGYSQLNCMGLFACTAAYEGGEEWLAQLKEYLYGNIIYMRDFIHDEIPQLTFIEPEGTYLMWVDFRRLGLTEAQREELVTERAGLWLDSGAMFGSDGEGFERFNIACTRSVLKEALTKLKAAVNGIDA